jgi:hypothetical protein
MQEYVQLTSLVEKKHLNNIPTELAIRQNVKVQRQLFRPEILPTVCEEECLKS